jgi:inosose dehydratase
MTTTLFDPKKVPLGITPTLWWNDDFISIDIGIPFGQCVSEMALAGFEGCSTGHKYPTDPAVLKPALELRGLRVSEPWVSTYFTIGMKRQTLELFHRQMEFLVQMDATDMVVAEFGAAVNPLPLPVFADRPIFDDQQWDALCEGLNELGKMADDRKMRLCYHPHMGTGVMIKDDIDRLMAGTDPDMVHLLLDTGHLEFAGVTACVVAEQYGRRIKHIHLKNVRAGIVDLAKDQNFSFQDAVEAGVFTVPGDPAGSIEFGPIFDALVAAKFEGWLVIEAEQDPAKANPLQYAKMARAFLRRQLGY